MKLFALLLLTLSALYLSNGAVDYRLNLEASACTPRNCTAKGPLCETCSKLVGCIDNGDGTWDKTLLATCTAPQYCVNGACTSDPDPYCSGLSDLPFVCQRVGIFPDPFYVTKYVLCVKDGASLKPFINECEDGYGFNIADDLCSVAVKDGSCPVKEYPVPLCTKPGETGPIPKKPAMYYLCEERTYDTNKKALYPYLNICDGGVPYVNYTCKH